MRKLLVVLAVAALSAGLLSPAEAATKRYRITMNATQVKEGGVLKKQSVIDVSNGHEKDLVRLSGRVTGGPVKGRSVLITAYNTNNGNKKYNLGSVKLSSSGSFSKYHKPVNGGRWKYLISRPKHGSYKAATTRTVYVDAYHWTYLYELNSAYPAGVSRIHSGSDVPREKIGSPGQVFGEELIFLGGSQMSFPTKAYRCKKIGVKVGVSNSSEPNVISGTTQFRQGAKLMFEHTAGIQGKVIDTGLTDTASTAKRNSLSPTADLLIKVLAPTYVPDPEQPQDPPVVNEPGDLRVVVGNAKAFCTFPSVNLDL